MKYLNLILVLLQVYLLSCTTSTPVAGGSETTNGICAHVYQPNGKPAAKSKVRLRHENYDALIKENVFQADSFTDSNGYFLIKDIEPGKYYVEVQNDSGAYIFILSIDETDMDTTNLGEAKLEPFAALKGSIDTLAISGKKLFARIKGLERVVEVNNDGSFLFDDLPAGFFKVLIDTSDDTKEIVNVKATPQDTVSITVSGNSRYSGIVYYKPELAGVNPDTIITDFPLVIRLNSSTFDFELAQLDGSDIHFAKPDGKPLSHDIEQWDPKSKNGVIWVSLDSVQTGNKEPFIIMKWGLSGSYKKPDLSLSVFDTTFGFAGTWHLNENPANGIGAIKDRTENGFHGTCAATMNDTNVVSGICGSALSFDGIDDSIETGLVDITSSYSLSCWVNIANRADTNECSNLRILIKEPSYTLWYATRDDGVRAEHYSGFGWKGFPQDTPDSVYHKLERGSWYYLTSTFDGDKIRLYINGVIVDSTVSIETNPLASSNPLFIGGRTYVFPETDSTAMFTVNEFFGGVIDEVRVENRARSAEWIKLCYISQLPESNFATCKTKVW